MKKLGIYVMFLALFLVSFANIAFANKFMDQVATIADILNIISSFVILISLFAIVFGIIKYFNAKDDKDKKQKAKNAILTAIIFLFISFMVYASINLSIPGPYGGGLIE